MLQKCKNVLSSQRGQGLSEYGLIIALIAVACILALTFVGKQAAEKFKGIGEEIRDAEPVKVE